MIGEIKDPKAIVERWPGFAPAEDEDGEVKPNRLIGHSRVHFTDDAVVVDLRKSVTLLDGTVTKQLALNEPCAQDLQAMDGPKGAVAKSTALLGAIANIKPSEVARIAGADFVLLNEVVNGFLSDGQGTPGT